MKLDLEVVPGINHNGVVDGNLDIISRSPLQEWLVCGYFTPDYRHWAENLAASLRTHAAPFHLLSKPKAAGGWEGNTRAKPGAILSAMDRYPEHVIVWLDVDCTVHGDLAPLARCRADVAAFAQTRRLPTRPGATRRGRQRLRYNVRSGTMVFRPTSEARGFAECWAALCADAAACDHDQDGLLLTLGQATRATFEALGPQWCARDTETVANAVIVHASARRDQMTTWARLAERLKQLKKSMRVSPTR